MATKQTTAELSERQETLLVALLKRVESATSAKEAVWLNEDERQEIAEIRTIIED